MIVFLNDVIVFWLMAIFRMQNMVVKITALYCKPIGLPYPIFSLVIRNFKILKQVKYQSVRILVHCNTRCALELHHRQCRKFLDIVIGVGLGLWIKYWSSSKINSFNFDWCRSRKKIKKKNNRTLSLSRSQIHFILLVSHRIPIAELSRQLLAGKI